MVQLECSGFVEKNQSRTADSEILKMGVASKNAQKDALGVKCIRQPYCDWASTPADLA